MRKNIFIVMLLLGGIALSAQEHKELQAEKWQPYHRISISMLNGHIPSINSGSGAFRNTIVPIWGFDYDYWFHPNWGVGLHNDWTLQQFKVLKEEGGTLVERSRPFSMSLTALYKPTEHLVFTVGAGKEWERSEHLGLVNLGIEYGWELPKDWELSVNGKYEKKISVYTTWMFGLGVSKKLISPAKSTTHPHH